MSVSHADDAVGCFFIVWLRAKMRHQIGRSTGKSVDPFEGGEIVVPIRTTGNANMRGGP